MAYRDARYTVFDAGGVREMPGDKGRGGGFLSLFARSSLAAGWMANCFQLKVTSQLLSNLCTSRSQHLEVWSQRDGFPKSQFFVVPQLGAEECPTQGA